MRTALRVLSLEEVVHDVGIGFEVMRDTVNSFSQEILRTGRDGRDQYFIFMKIFSRFLILKLASAMGCTTHLLRWSGT